MRIIDKRKDYYDNALPYSSEPVWVRKESAFVIGDTNPYNIDKSVIEHFKDAFNTVPTPTFRSISSHPHHTVVVMCGKMYVVYWKNVYLGRPQDIVSADRPSKFVGVYNDSEKDKRDHIHISKEDSVSRWFGRNFNDKSLDVWYNHTRTFRGLDDTHRAFKSPVFLIEREARKAKVVINPLLCNVGFQCVIDPWVAYTTIDQYVGNDMVDCPLDTFTMSDELKRDSKGMDDWSFKQRGPKARKLKKT